MGLSQQTFANHNPQQNTSSGDPTEVRTFATPHRGKSRYWWPETIIYGHRADEHQNPCKIRLFNRPFPERFLARGMVRAGPSPILDVGSGASLRFKREELLKAAGFPSEILDCLAPRVNHTSDLPLCGRCARRIRAAACGWPFLLRSRPSSSSSLICSIVRPQRAACLARAISAR